MATLNITNPNTNGKSKNKAVTSKKIETSLELYNRIRSYIENSNFDETIDPLPKKWSISTLFKPKIKKY